jgi:hypothetical protein
MKNALIAMTAGLVIASGAAFAQTSALDVEGQPARSTSQEFVPALGLSGGNDYTADEFSAANGFGDYSPVNGASQRQPGVDYTPTASIGTATDIRDEFSADNGFGDHSPASQVLSN